MTHNIINLALVELFKNVLHFKPEESGLLDPISLFSFLNFFKNAEDAVTSSVLK